MLNHCNYLLEEVKGVLFKGQGVRLLRLFLRFLRNYQGDQKASEKVNMDSKSYRQSGSLLPGPGSSSSPGLLEKEGRYHLGEREDFPVYCSLN